MGEAIRRRGAGLRSLRDRLIPSLAVGFVTVLVTVTGRFRFHLGKAPRSGTNRPVPGIRATGDCPGTLIPLAGRLQYQGGYWGWGKANSFYADSAECCSQRPCLSYARTPFTGQ